MNKIFKLIFIVFLFFRSNLLADPEEKKEQTVLYEAIAQQIDIKILTEKDKTFLEKLVFYAYEKPKEFFLENKKITLASLLFVSYLLKIVDDNRFVFYEQDEYKNIFVRKKYRQQELKKIPKDAIKEVDIGNNDLSGNESEDEL